MTSEFCGFHHEIVLQGFWVSFSDFLGYFNRRLFGFFFFVANTAWLVKSVLQMPIVVATGGENFLNP